MYKKSTDPTAIIRISDMAVIPKDPANIDYQAFLVWESAGNTVEPEMPATPEKIEADKVAIVQNFLDGAARALRYDDIRTAVTYAEEPAVPKFQAEGQALRAWRSLVWATCYAILAEVQAGTREIPTDEELISELPALVLPA